MTNKPQRRLPLLGAHSRQPSLLGWIHKKKVSCCFSAPAWGGVAKEAVNRVFQAHLIACHDLITQVLLEHHLLTEATHTQIYTSTQSLLCSWVPYSTCIICTLGVLKPAFLRGHLW